MAYTTEVNEHDFFKDGTPIADAAKYDRLKRNLDEIEDGSLIIEIGEVGQIFNPIISPFGMVVRSSVSQFEDWVRSQGCVFSRSGFFYTIKAVEK